MMCIVALAAIMLSPTDAHRVNHDIDSGALKSESGMQFFNSCDELQNMFRNRVASIQALQEAHPDSSSFSATTHARFTMKAFGAVRILRRARDCAWVVDGNTDEIEHVRSVAHSALAGNPCGDAALVALSAPASPENVLHPLQQAVQILFSDNCEVPSEGMVQTEVIDPDDGNAISHRLMDGEDQTQDSIDELMDAAASESESLAAGAFIQTQEGFNRVSRLLGAVFLTILYLLSCATAAAIIGGLLLYVVGLIPCSIMISGSSVLACLLFPFAGVVLGGASGLLTCGVDLAYAQGNFSQLGRGSF